MLDDKDTRQVKSTVGGMGQQQCMKACRVQLAALR